MKIFCIFALFAICVGSPIKAHSFLIINSPRQGTNIFTDASREHPAEESEYLIMEEVWKDVIGYEGLYSISNYGKIKSIPRNGTVKNVIFLKPNNTQEYPVVRLYKNNIGAYLKIHRLVALHFVENHFNKPFVNHKDGNKFNYIVTNLEWVTAKENSVHAHKTGLHKHPAGDDAIDVKIKSHQKSEIIKLFLSGISQKNIAKIYNVSQPLISMICKNIPHEQKSSTIKKRIENTPRLHGTMNMYKYGCRCVDCLNANRIKSLHYRMNKKAIKEEAK